MIEVVGAEAIQSKLAALKRVASDTKPVLTEIGEYIQATAKLSLTNEEDVYGKKFADLKESTKRRKKSPAIQILLESGALHRVSYRVGENSVTIGTNAHSAKGYSYPTAHQFGALMNKTSKKGKNYAISIPKRAFFPVELAGGGVVLTKDAQKEVEDILQKGIVDALKSVGSS